MIGVAMRWNERGKIEIDHSTVVFILPPFSITLACITSVSCGRYSWITTENFGSEMCQNPDWMNLNTTVDRTDGDHYGVQRHNMYGEFRFWWWCAADGINSK